MSLVYQFKIHTPLTHSQSIEENEAYKQLFEEIKLSGWKLVNQFGRIYDYANDSNISPTPLLPTYHTTFVRNYNNVDEESIRGNIKIILDTKNDDSDYSKTMKDIGKKTFGILHKQEQRTNKINMRCIHQNLIFTPHGWQKPLLKKEDGATIYLWKPKKGLYWYDTQQLTLFLAKAKICEQTLEKYFQRKRTLKERLQDAPLRKTNKKIKRTISHYEPLFHNDFQKWHTTINIPEDLELRTMDEIIQQYA